MRTWTLFLVASPVLRNQGQSALFSTAANDVLEAKFATLKKAFPADIDVVKAGGWNNLVKLSGDPKAELVNMIVDGLKSGSSKVEFKADEEKLEALAILLYGMGKGFESDVVEGDWALVFSRQGKKSPKFQRLVGKKEKVRYSLNKFDTKAMTFSGDIKLLKKGLVHSTVKVRLQ